MDRPFPAAPPDPPLSEAWPLADLRFARTPQADLWLPGPELRDGLPEAWQLEHDGLRFEVRPAPSGQVGFFPEQIENWQWLHDTVRELARRDAEPPAVLNLFGYTGGSTLIAARAGASVTHVDASRPSVAWARRNAVLSGLEDAPIRWIVDDALSFAEREGRRRRRYDGIVLDPPSYGHGPGGRRWQLSEQLERLLASCLVLTAGDPSFVLLTAHTAGLDAEALGAALIHALRPLVGSAAQDVEADELLLRAATGREARAGVVARWRR